MSCHRTSTELNMQFAQYWSSVLLSLLLYPSLCSWCSLGMFDPFATCCAFFFWNWGGFGQKLENENTMCCLGM